MEPEASSGERALISTTSRLVGDYQGQAVGLALAFPQLDSIRERWTESPMSRSGVVVAYDTQPFEGTGASYSTVDLDVAHCVLLRTLDAVRQTVR